MAIGWARHTLQRPNRVFGSVLNSTFPVARAQRELVAQLRRQLVTEESKLRRVSESSLPDFVKALEAAGVTVAK